MSLFEGNFTGEFEALSKLIYNEVGRLDLHARV